MLNWLKHKQYPNFWNNYTKLFKNKLDEDLNHVRFVVFDTETTGLNINKDRILSIGAVSVIGNTIDISNSFEAYIKQDVFSPETVEIHGILKEGITPKLSEEETVKQFLIYIENAVLVAHHTGFDVGMINQCLKRMGLPKLKNKTLDTGHLFKKTTLCTDINTHYGLDELAETFNIKKHDRHTASGDAYITALLLLKILSNLKKTGAVTLKNLLFNYDGKRLI